ncbi:PREDICTED: sn1-specific diacylglycerol lipase beta-like [Polistes canadensis]|uniref:sn1-specific diacylglycerol lipase beta-like n=1 Tax=Polistes canadensis TaxID=91411 RepID=UPI000718B316|nr:PREDICTED: sn1-specific diacylglycerol lipase beta-like [Polistes canadensis]
MKLSVESTEDLRTSLLDTLAACRLPKYRVILNGFGYALHGVPEQDLDNTWENSDIINPLPIQSPLLTILTNTYDVENKVLARDISQRRFSKMRLYNAGLILHLSRCKHTETDTKSKKNKKEKKYEMRWAQPEEFTKLIVMPRMLLDHLPENLEKALVTLIVQQKDLPIYFDP